MKDAADPTGQPQPQKLPDFDPSFGGWKEEDLDHPLRALKTALSAEHAAIVFALKKQSQLEEHFAGEEAFVKYFCDGQPSDVVDLNVSGDRVSVNRSTLRVCEGSMLACQFDTQWQPDGGDDADSDSDDGALIDHSSYCFGKIIDQMRLKRMFPAGMQCLERPEVVPHERSSFERIVKYYFPGQESFILDGVKKFAFKSLDDETGVLHFLGIRQGSASWKNPHDIEQVVSTRSDGRSNLGPILVGRSVSEAGWCDGGDGVIKSVECDLKTVRVRPTGYSLGHIDCCRPSNWVLEGSVDGTNFVVLHRVGDNRDITSGATAYFPVTGADFFFQLFRLRATNGPDQSCPECFCFHICNFELYGDMKRTESCTPMDI